MGVTRRLVCHTNANGIRSGCRLGYFLGGSFAANHLRANLVTNHQGISAGDLEDACGVNPHPILATVTPDLVGTRKLGLPADSHE